MTNSPKKEPPSCDSCLYHAYDEEYASYFCERMMDEDEMNRYSFGPQARCPFYQYDDEYINVRKQI